VGERGEEIKIELPTQTMEQWELEVILEQIIALKIHKMRGTSAEFACKRLNEAVALAKDALKIVKEMPPVTLNL
jgi:hypothetical protein